jgi:hypothetical protein
MVKAEKETFMDTEKRKVRGTMSRNTISNDSKRQQQESYPSNYDMRDLQSILPPIRPRLSTQEAKIARERKNNNK